MKKVFIIRLSLIIFVSSLLSSCYTMKMLPEKVDYDNYLGFSVEQIIEKLGDPKIELLDANNCKILVFDNIISDTRSKVQKQSITKFFFNIEDQVYKWESNATQDVLKKKFSAGKLIGLILGIDAAVGVALFAISELAYY